MAHPVRAKLLFAVSERSRQGVGVRQLSERLREPSRRVRYHLDALLELGLISVTRKQTRGGAVERLFAAKQTPWLTSEQVDWYDVDLARQISLQILRAVLADASLSIASKVFARRSGHILIRLPAEVDGEGWNQLGSIQVRALQEMRGVIAECEERLEASSEMPISAVVAHLLLEVPPWPAS